VNEDQKKDAALQVKGISYKLELLRNFMIVAEEGVRQQQSAANDEIISVLHDINSQMTSLLRRLEG
jgi:hypothetical protein